MFHTWIDDDDSEFRIEIKVEGLWKIYKAKVEAILIDGSYCYNNQHFNGRIAGPAIDTKGSNPGAWWYLASNDDLVNAKPHTVAMFYQSNAKSALIDYLGNTDLKK